MAIWDNLKMNPTNILIGIGVAVAVPVVLPVVATVIRPLAKAAIKGGFALVGKGDGICRRSRRADQRPLCRGQSRAQCRGRGRRGRP